MSTAHDDPLARGLTPLPRWRGSSFAQRRRVLLSMPLLLPIWLYQLVLSPIIGNQCRYRPTCSRYAFAALCEHGPLRGSVLAVGRVLRCHPLSKGGYDPVPLRPTTPSGGRSAPRRGSAG